MVTQVPGSRRSSSAINGCKSRSSTSQTRSWSIAKYTWTTRCRMPTICSHGSFGDVARAFVETRLAASPISWMQLTTARRNIGSVSRFGRERPDANASASLAAQSMCVRRTLSSASSSGGDIQVLRLLEHLLTKQRGEIPSSPKIHLNSQSPGQLRHHPANVEQADAPSRLKFDEQIQVAVGSCRPPVPRAEYGKARNPIAPAKLADVVSIEIQLNRIRHIPIRLITVA